MPQVVDALAAERVRCVRPPDHHHHHHTMKLQLEFIFFFFLGRSDNDEPPPNHPTVARPFLDPEFIGPCAANSDHTLHPHAFDLNPLR